MLRPVKSLMVLVTLAVAIVSASAQDYAVVVSQKTAGDPQWKQVVAALKEKHHATLIVYPESVEQVRAELAKLFPRYACFVATPEEAGRNFVAAVHQLTRTLDDDPYTDVFWGILTGYDAASALRIAQHDAPLVIRKAAAGTEIALENFVEGAWYSELQPGHVVRKPSGGKSLPEKGAADSTGALADTLTKYKADLFVTSGHATEHGWQIGYSYRNGQFRCQDGVLLGVNTKGEKFPIRSSNPKVYLAVGNCLMGHVDSRDAMALAFMNSCGVNQMFGYTVNSWYGYAGWGVLDYFVEQPGRFTLTQAFFANQHALVHRLGTFFPELLGAEFKENERPNVKLTDAAKSAGLTAQDGMGLLYDRDVVAFYGDPAWDARLAAQPSGWEQTLTEHDGVFTLEVKPLRGAHSFDLISGNGSQRGGRPFVQFLPHRVKDVQVLDGAKWKPVITDNFILVPLSGESEKGQNIKIVFRASTNPRRL